MKEKIIKNKNTLIIILAYMISYYILIKQYISEYTNVTYKEILLFIGISLIIIFFTILLLLFIKKTFKNRHVKYEKIFLQIAVVYGLVYTIFIPAMMGTDELAHFLRSYQISTGQILVKEPEKNKTYMPKQLLSVVYDKTRIKYSMDNIVKTTNYHNNDIIWYGDITAVSYSPLIYLPQIIGFIISKVLRLSPIITLIIVRLFNFISWTLLMYFSIKNLKSFKISNIILFTSPAVLSLVSTSSGDVLSTACIILFITLILKYKEEKKLLNKKQQILLAIIALLFSSFKLFYVIITLMLILLPKECFKNKKIKYFYLIVILISCFFVDFGWFLISKVKATNGNNIITEQIKFIMNNPINYIFILINTYIGNCFYYFSNLFAGNEMCYGTVRLNDLFVILYITIFVISIYTNKEQIKLKKSERYFIILVIISLITLISTSLYVDWTARYNGIGSNNIIGIQSRYFLSVIPMIITLIPTKYNKNINKENLLKIAIIINSLLIINTFKSLIITVLK